MLSVESSKALSFYGYLTFKSVTIFPVINFLV